MEQEKPGSADIGNGLNEAALAGIDQEDLGGTGGSSGGGTVAGGGEPSGGPIQGANADASGADAAGNISPTEIAAGSLAGLMNDEIAAEAAALGSADGSLADAAHGGSGRANTAPTIGEAVGTGAGRADIGSGTPADRGELGGGGPLGQEGGAGPGGTSAP